MLGRMRPYNKILRLTLGSDVPGQRKAIPEPSILCTCHMCPMKSIMLFEGNKTRVSCPYANMKIHHYDAAKSRPASLLQMSNTIR